MEHERIEVGALLGRVGSILMAAPGAAIAFVVALSALGAVVDIATQESSQGFLLVTAASIVAGYFLLLALLRGSSLLAEGEGGGFGAYFGTSFLGGLGTLLAFLLLIVPGLILLVRWSASLAWVVAEDDGASNALSESWELTRGNFWPIFAAMLVGLIPLIIFVAVIGMGMEFANIADTEVSGPVEIIAGNLIGNLFSVFSTALGVAVYSTLRVDRRGLSEAFA